MNRLFAASVCVLLGANAFCQDPRSVSIEEAVQFGLKHNPKLRAGAAEVESARAKTRGARGMEGPQLVLNGFAARSTMPTIFGSAMGVSPSTSVMAPEGRWLDAGLMLMVPLYSGGALSAMTAASKALEEAAVGGLFEMRAEVALDIRIAYSEALNARKQVSAAEARLQAAKSMADNARALLAAGKGIEASVRRAEAEAAEAEAELVVMRADEKKMILDLLLVMGEQLDAPITLAPTREVDLPLPTLSQLLAAAKTSRGESVRARHNLRAAQSERRAAEAALRPQLYGVAMGDLFSPQDGMGRRSGNALGLALSFPLYDGGQRRAATQRAAAMVAVAEAELADVERRIETEIRKAWLDYEAATQMREAAERGQQAAKAAYDTQVVRVESGVGIFVDQLDALAALTRSTAGALRADLNVQLAIAKLYRAAGLTGPLSSTEVSK